MNLRRVSLVVFIAILLVLSSCSSADKEIKAYFDKVLEDIMEDESQDEYVLEYIELIFDDQPYDAVDHLKDKALPSFEEKLERIQNLEADHENTKKFNKQLELTAELDFRKQMMFKDIFDDVIENVHLNDMHEIKDNVNLDALYELNEELSEAGKGLLDLIEEMTEEYDFLELNESTEEMYDSLDVAYLNEGNEELVERFIVAVLNTSDAEGDDEESANSASGDENESQDEVGNQDIVLNGGIEIDDTFHVKGESNLDENSTLLFKMFNYGYENSSVRNEIIVDKDGNFELEIELSDDDYTGDPIEVQIGYLPEKENEEIHERYGAEGEKLTGNNVHQYTNIKRIRHGAYAYAYLDLEKGEKVNFEEFEWDHPDDYGELDIWMEEENIEIKEDYYDITMKSNLVELTKIRGSIEIPGYEVAGYSSHTNVFPDGSFRIQVPRPEIEDETVIVVLEADSGFALDIEDLYGENGENFEGDLVEETKKGQRIIYKLTVE